MKVQIGSSQQELPGFINVDIRPVGRNARRGHAGDLSFAADGAVDLLFSNAVFEHLYLGQQAGVLREWRRVVGQRGCVVCLGIPNFPEIARRYVEGAPGLLGPTFDLYHVYRYTHGDPEDQTSVDWRRFSPARNRNAAPDEWLPQLHKSLFDAPTLHRLFAEAGWQPSVFEYAFPGEPYALNLGVVAGGSVEVGLDAVPEVTRWIDRSTMRSLSASSIAVEMAERATRLDGRRPNPLRRMARRAKRSWVAQRIRSR